MITVYFIEEIPKCQEKMDDSPIFCPLPRLRHPTKRYNWAGLIHINPPTHSHYFCAASLYRGGGDYSALSRGRNHEGSAQILKKSRWAMTLPVYSLGSLDALIGLYDLRV